MKFFSLIVSLFILAGCTSGPRLDTSHPSVNHDNRIQFVVVHYTSASLERSLALLTHGEVSAHYLIGDDKGATIYKLVDEGRRAWHAGKVSGKAGPGSIPAPSASKSSIRVLSTHPPGASGIPTAKPRSRP